jgi:hypothetical protein
MKIKKFENFKEEFLEIEDLFIDIKDLKHDSFQIRGDNRVLDKKYGKVLRTESKVSRNGNFIFIVYCDYLYNHSIENEIRREIVPRIKSLGYSVTINNVKTSETVCKIVPTSSGGTGTVFDPVHRISVTVKYN